MNAKRLLMMNLAVLIGFALMTPGWAGSLGSVNIFKNPSKKQTHQDFKPAPDKIKTNYGTGCAIRKTPRNVQKKARRTV
jgi:hypothetical protein